MKLVDVMSKHIYTHMTIYKVKTYVTFNKENHEKDPKVEVGDHVRTLKHKSTFVKGQTPIGLKKFLYDLIKLKTLCHGPMLLVI